MYHNPTRSFAALVCLALLTCASLVAGVAEDGVSSLSSSSEWSAPPLSPRHPGSPSPWGHVVNDPVTSLLAGPLRIQPTMRLHTQLSERTARPLRILSPGVPKRLYFAPRLGKRSPSLAEGLDERSRRDAATFPEEPEAPSSVPYRWWWPLVSVRRSSFSPRPGKRAEGQTEVDLPYDYLTGDLYDAMDEEDDEIEDEEDEADEDEEDNASILQDKRGSGFAFSPRLGKREGASFAFAPRPGKKSNTFAFAPRPGKKANFAFAPRPGKRTNFAFAPRPGKKNTFAFAPRPGKKTSFAFSPRLGKKATFAFAPRPGKRADTSSETGQRQAGETWWLGEADGAAPTTLPPFLPPRLE